MSIFLGPFSDWSGFPLAGNLDRVSENFLLDSHPKSFGFPLQRHKWVEPTRKDDTRNSSSVRASGEQFGG